MSILINKYFKIDILFKILLFVLIILFNIYFIYEFIKLGNINNNIYNIIIDTNVNSTKCIQFRDNIINFNKDLPNVDVYSMTIIIITIIFASIFFCIFLIGCLNNILCKIFNKSYKNNNTFILRLMFYLITFLNIILMFCFLINYIVIFNNYKNMEKCFMYSDLVNEGLYNSYIMLISIIIVSFFIFCVFILYLELYNLYNSLHKDIQSVDDIKNIDNVIKEIDINNNISDIKDISYINVIKKNNELNINENIYYV